jgi:hypothetical protein
MKTWMKILAFLLFLAACADDFKPTNQVLGVRILAASASAPFAKPGETVKVEVLAIDGRSAGRKTVPMTLSYLPGLCVNPKNDDPNECYPGFAGSYVRGVNLSASLPQGAERSFVIPPDTERADAQGYGVAFAFFIACAGHVEYVGAAATYPTAPPFGCFDTSGKRLASDDTSFAFARFYVSSLIRNANPAIESITAQDLLVQANGLDLPRCTVTDQAECPSTKIDVRVLPENQETDAVASAGRPGRPALEELTVSYFVTGGKMARDSAVLYAARSGRVENTSVSLLHPQAPGASMLYAVLRDNRGGVSWKSVAVRTQ